MKNTPFRTLPDPPKKARLFLDAYLITEDGKVWSNYTWKYLKPHLHMSIAKYAYHQVFLKHPDGRPARWYKIHRIVAFLYCPNPDPSVYTEVNHKDRDKLHNHYTNLEWVTKSQNIKHSYTHKDKQGNYRERPKHRKGAIVSEETRALMRERKTGVHHPRFIGFYTYEGKEYTSMNQLGIELGKGVTQVKRMVEKGLVAFRPKSIALSDDIDPQTLEELRDLSA